MTHLLALLFFANVHAAPVATSIGKIDAIEGTGQVTLVRGGRTYTARKSNLLLDHDELRTGDQVAVRIAYQDGSRQLLASKTRMKLRMKGGIPSPEFVEGAVDSQVKPEEKPTGKPRFFFRSKSVVLGVRGTEFVVHTGPKGLEVHTLKGVVEAVRDEKDFGTPKAIAINEAFEMVGITGTALPAPSSFVPSEFLGNVAAKYPELGKLLTGN